MQIIIIHSAGNIVFIMIVLKLSAERGPALEIEMI